MWSRKAWTVVFGLVIAVTGFHPSNAKTLYQKSLPNDVERKYQMNSAGEKENAIELNVVGRHSIKPKKTAPVVDDDLLEFLVRVADNPAEWNKIQRVLSMLGRDETSESTEGEPTTAATTTTTTTTTTAQPKQSTPQQVPAASWPSGDWIMEMSERLEAAALARGIGAGGAVGPDPYDYDDGGDDDDDDDDDEDGGTGVGGGGGGGGGGSDEIEEIDVGELSTAAAAEQPPPPPPHPPVAAGHMSRYQFRRIDGSPDDGRVNGTYVAVVESKRPPRDVVYDSARQKNPKSVK